MPKVIIRTGRDIVLQIKRAREDERDNNGPMLPYKVIFGVTISLKFPLLDFFVNYSVVVLFIP